MPSHLDGISILDAECARRRALVPVDTIEPIESPIEDKATQLVKRKLNTWDSLTKEEQEQRVHQLRLNWLYATRTKDEAQQNNFFSSATIHALGLEILRQAIEYEKHKKLLTLRPSNPARRRRLIEIRTIIPPDSRRQPAPTPEADPYAIRTGANTEPLGPRRLRPQEDTEEIKVKRSPSISESPKKEHRKSGITVIEPATGTRTQSRIPRTPTMSPSNKKSKSKSPQQTSDVKSSRVTPSNDQQAGPYKLHAKVLTFRDTLDPACSDRKSGKSSKLKQLSNERIAPGDSDDDEEPTTNKQLQASASSSKHPQPTPTPSDLVAVPGRDMQRDPTVTRPAVLSLEEPVVKATTSRRITRHHIETIELVEPQARAWFQRDGPKRDWKQLFPSIQRQVIRLARIGVLSDKEIVKLMNHYHVTFSPDLRQALWLEKHRNVRDAWNCYHSVGRYLPSDGTKKFPRSRRQVLFPWAFNKEGVPHSQYTAIMRDKEPPKDIFASSIAAIDRVASDGSFWDDEDSDDDDDEVIKLIDNSAGPSSRPGGIQVQQTRPPRIHARSGIAASIEQDSSEVQRYPSIALDPEPTSSDDEPLPTRERQATVATFAALSLHRPIIAADAVYSSKGSAPRSSPHADSSSSSSPSILSDKALPSSQTSRNLSSPGTEHRGKRSSSKIAPASSPPGKPRHKSRARETTKQAIAPETNDDESKLPLPPVFDPRKALLAAPQVPEVQTKAQRKAAKAEKKKEQLAALEASSSSLPSSFSTKSSSSKKRRDPKDAVTADAPKQNDDTVSRPLSSKMDTANATASPRTDTHAAPLMAAESTPSPLKDRPVGRLHRLARAERMKRASTVPLLIQQDPQEWAAQPSPVKAKARARLEEVKKDLLTVPLAARLANRREKAAVVKGAIYEDKVAAVKVAASSKAQSESEEDDVEESEQDESSAVAAKNDSSDSESSDDEEDAEVVAPSLAKLAKPTGVPVSKVNVPFRAEVRDNAGSSADESSDSDEADDESSDDESTSEVEEAPKVVKQPVSKPKKKNRTEVAMSGSDAHVKTSKAFKSTKSDKSAPDATLPATPPESKKNKLKTAEAETTSMPKQGKKRSRDAANLEEGDAGEGSSTANTKIGTDTGIHKKLALSTTKKSADADEVPSFGDAAVGDDNAAAKVSASSMVESKKKKKKKKNSKEDVAAEDDPTDRVVAEDNEPENHEARVKKARKGKAVVRVVADHDEAEDVNVNASATVGNLDDPVLVFKSAQDNLRFPIKPYEYESGGKQAMQRNTANAKRATVKSSTNVQQSNSKRKADTNLAPNAHNKKCKGSNSSSSSSSSPVVPKSSHNITSQSSPKQINDAFLAGQITKSQKKRSIREANIRMQAVADFKRLQQPRNTGNGGYTNNQDRRGYLSTAPQAPRQDRRPLAPLNNNNGYAGTQLLQELARVILAGHLPT